MFLLAAIPLACEVDQLRAENLELAAQLGNREAEIDLLVAEVASLQLEVESCSTVRALDASLERSYGGTDARCEQDGERLSFSSDPQLLLSGAAFGNSGAVRVVPSFTPDGDSRGIRVYSIRAGSLADSCGFANGDVITAVNGQAIRTLGDWNADGGAVEFTAYRRSGSHQWVVSFE